MTDVVGSPSRAAKTKIENGDDDGGGGGDGDAGDYEEDEEEEDDDDDGGDDGDGVGDHCDEGGVGVHNYQ